MSQEYITFTIGSKKNIALIAHDNEKPKLIAWCKEHKDELEKHNLYGPPDAGHSRDHRPAPRLRKKRRAIPQPGQRQPHPFRRG